MFVANYSNGAACKIVSDSRAQLCLKSEIKQVWLTDLSDIG